MADLAKLVVRLEAQTAQYMTALDGANKKLDRFEKNTSSSLKSIQKAYGSLGKMAGMVGVGLSAGAIVSGLTQAAAAAIEFGDEMMKASAKTGMSVESMSELAHAAKMSDIELDGLSTALKKMQVNMSEAESGSKAVNETLTALGLTIGDLKRLSPDQQFELLADRIAALKDPADRVRAAVELFGKAGADLLPMFEKGAEGIRKLREEADTMTTAQAEKLAEADTAIKNLSKSWSDFTRDLTARIAPALTAALDAVTNVMSAAPTKLTPTQALESVAAAFRANGIATTWTDILQQIQEEQRKREELAKGLKAWANTGAVTDKPTVPGFTTPATKPPKVAKLSGEQWLEQMGLGEIPIAAREITTGAVDQMYSEWNEATKTAAEKQADELIAFQGKLDELVKAGRITDDEAVARLLEFDDIKITVGKVEVPPEVKDDLSVFMEEAARNTQDIIADTLVNGFDEGVDGMLRSFAQMLQQMAAQALAAQIAEKIFGKDGKGGWLDTAIGAVGSFFGFGGTRDSGGRGRPGQAYAIGTGAQPEMFVPDQPGKFVPAEQWMGAAKPQVNLRNINAFDTGVIRDYLLSSSGEQVILNFIQRNGTRVRMATAGR